MFCRGLFVAWAWVLAVILLGKGESFLILRKGAGVCVYFWGHAGTGHISAGHWLCCYAVVVYAGCGSLGRLFLSFFALQLASSGRAG